MYCQGYALSCTSQKLKHVLSTSQSLHSAKRAAISNTAHLARLRQQGDVRCKGLLEDGVSMQTIQPGVGGLLTCGKGAQVAKVATLDLRPQDQQSSQAHGYH
jgi:hypothetical protein